MAGVLWNRHVQWMGLRSRFMGASTALIVAGTLVFGLRHLEYVWPQDPVYDLEFTGGQRVVVALASKMSMSEVHERLAKNELRDVAIRTIRGRGADSEKLDLSVESDSFEFTARTRDEEKGREFERRIKQAFQDRLAPEPIPAIQIAKADASGRIPVTLEVNFSGKAVDSDQVKRALHDGSGMFREAVDLAVKPGTAREGASAVVIEAKILPSEGKNIELAVNEQVRQALHARPGLEISEPVPQSDFIGPGVALQLRQQAMLAVVLSIIAQIVYLRFRFRDFTYGFAAAIALLHDVFITLGIVAVFDGLGIAHVKINLPVIASFLTLIGYSMNDTIVVFDRIRENLGRSTHPSSTLIDNAINQTLARSIRTSMTVWLVALALFFVNYGAASSLEGFAFVMVVGVLTGTYSSVAIASPLLLFLPVYFAELRRLGKTAERVLLAAMAVGTLLAIAGEGKVALLGAAMACVLPAHFLFHVAIWIRKDDPDALVRQSEATAPA
jgi:preprotein translocase SecF subunit